jgi:hypothetical protein
MVRRSGASALAGVAALVGLVGLTGCSPRGKAERRGPFLSISARETAPGARGLVPPGSIALALGGLPPGELTRLQEFLAHSADVAARRAAPAIFDLGLAEEDAGPAPDPLRQALPNVPAVTAAANVLGAPWSAPGMSVRLGPTCDGAAARCVALFSPAADGDDPLLRRGRALAWSLGNAALLRVPAGSRAARLQSLRETQTRPSSTIALVFGATRGALDEAEIGRMRDQARARLEDLAGDAPQRPWLEALVAARSTWELPIALDADEVLVVPRLSALARLQDFRSEVAGSVALTP